MDSTMPKDFEAQTIEAGNGETGHRAHVDLGPVGCDAKVVISSTTMPQRIVDAHETERTARPYTGLLNLLKGCLGSGILGIPFAFSHTGWGLGLIILAVTAVASAYGLFLLFACAHKLGGTDTSFSKLTAATYPWARPIVDFLIILNCMGTAISYLVVIGENLSVLSISVLGISSASFFSSPSFWKIIVFWGVVAPLGALKRLSMLKYSSIVGIVFIFYITLMTLVYAIAPFAEPCPEFSTAELHCGGTVVAFGNNGENILAAIPVFAFAFTCSENVFLVKSPHHICPYLAHSLHYSSDSLQSERAFHEI
jgi:amino acid permease